MRLLLYIFILFLFCICPVYASNTDPVLTYYESGEYDEIAYKRRNFYVISYSSELRRYFPEPLRQDNPYRATTDHETNYLIQMAKDIGWVIKEHRLRELNQQGAGHLRRYLQGLIAIQAKTALENPQ